MTVEDRAAWLAERQSYCTASDIAAVLGRNPHKRRADVLRAKVERTEKDIDRLAAVMAGRHLEGGIFAWHLEHRGFRGCLWSAENAQLLGITTTNSGLVVHPVVKCLAATPDGIVITDAGRYVVTEIKNVAHWTYGVWVDKGRRPVHMEYHAPRRMDLALLMAPEYYWIQLQVQMACLGLPFGRLVVCTGGNTRVDMDFEADARFMELVEREVPRFWDEVQAQRALRGEGSK